MGMHGLMRRPWPLTLLLSACSPSASDATPVDAGVLEVSVDAPADARWLADRTAGSGLEAIVRPLSAWSTFAARMQGGVCALDVNGDGRTDLLFPGVRDAGGTKLLVADAPFHFVDRSEALPASVKDLAALGCLAFDPDGDGDLDVLLTGVGALRLLENDAGKLVDVTTRVRTALDPASPLMAAVAFDADGDGDLDLAIASYGKYVEPPKPCAGGCVMAPSSYKGGRALLFLQGPDGAFDEASDRFVAPVTAPALVLLGTDLDEDGRVDLFVGNDTSAALDRYFRRGEDGTFEEKAEALGVAYTPKPTGLSSMSATDPDFDGDGHLDLIESTWEQEPSAVFLCNGTLGPNACTDASERLELFRGMQNLRWGQAAIDLDHDGVLELVEASGHVFLASDPMLPIAPTPPSAPLQVWTHARANEPLRQLPSLERTTGGRGLLSLDLDDDGDLDLIVSTANGSPMLYENVRTKRGNAVSVRLRGKGKNRFAVGARITVKTAALTRVALTHAGHGYLSSDASPVHFGIGDATTASIDVRWPSGKTSHVDAKPGLFTLDEP